MSRLSGLTIRQHQRLGIEVPVEFIVCDAHAPQVRFSPSSAPAAAHIIRAKAVDVSSGGMGLECRHFLPRMCEGIVRVFHPSAFTSSGDGGSVPQVLLEHPVKVRRVYLIGREPRYAIGLAFVNPQPDIKQRIASLVSMLGQSPQSANGLNAGQGDGHA